MENKTYESNFKFTFFKHSFVNRNNHDVKIYKSGYEAC